MRHRYIAGIRNFLIIAAIAGLGTFWREGLGVTESVLSQILLVVMVIGFAGMGYQYFRENRLKWLVIKPLLRVVIAICALGIVFLVVLGPRLLGDSVGGAGLIALVAALGLTIVWIVVQSRRY
jgi:hypothetical protein